MLLSKGNARVRNQPELKLNDEVPIDQMLVKEKETSDSILKDIWASSKNLNSHSRSKIGKLLENDKNRSTKMDKNVIIQSVLGRKKEEEFEKENWMRYDSDANNVKLVARKKTHPAVSFEDTEKVKLENSQGGNTYSDISKTDTKHTVKPSEVSSKESSVQDPVHVDNFNIQSNVENGRLNTVYTKENKNTTNSLKQDHILTEDVVTSSQAHVSSNTCSDGKIGCRDVPSEGHEGQRNSSSKVCKSSFNPKMDQTDSPALPVCDSKECLTGQNQSENIHAVPEGVSETTKSNSDWRSDERMTSTSNKQTYNNIYKQPEYTTGEKTEHHEHRRGKMERRMKMFAEHNGFLVVDVANDGNCMFASVIDQLHMCSDINYTVRSLRLAAVRHLKDNPHQKDGTHLELFLSYETWEQYLDRMEKNSEWGDHIILKAIVEILQRPVAVFNVSLTNQVSTFLHPDNPSFDQSHTRTLFLGHYGEEHYVSLRPADWEDNWYKQPSSCTNTENRTDEVHGGSIPHYVENRMSMDTLSNTPIPHLSFLVKYLLKPKYLKLKRIQNRCPDLLDQSTTYIEFAGSIAEELNFELTDKCASCSRGHVATESIDCTCCKCHKTCYKICNYGQGTSFALMVHVDRDVSSQKSIMPVTMSTHPGYSMIRVVDPDAWRVEDIYWSEELIPYLKHLHVKFRAPEQADVSLLSKRLIKGIEHPEWPTEASEWIHRERPGNWPSEDLVSKISDGGCLLVSRSPTNIDNPEIVWQYLFSSAEVRLVREGFTQGHRYCFSLLKVLVDCQTRNLPQKLTTNHLKHVMFYCSEIISPSFWTENPGGCLLFLLERLLENLRLQNLPNFFIKENNMISDHPAEGVKKLHDKIEALRKFPVLSLIFICERHSLLWNSNINAILDDMAGYRENADFHKTLRNVFVPLLINLNEVDLGYHGGGPFLHNLQESYELILSVPSMNREAENQDFQNFVLNILRPETQESDLGLVVCRLFLAFYVDHHFKTKVMYKMASEKECLTLKEILGAEYNGQYGEFLIPKECLRCKPELEVVNVITNFTDVLMKFRLHDQAAAHLKYGLSRIQRERQMLQSDVENIEKDIQGSERNTEKMICRDLHRKSTNEYNYMNRRIRNSEFYLLFTKLYACSLCLNKLELLQEYLERCEIVLEDMQCSWGYKVLSEIYRNLGNAEKGRELEQIAICLGMNLTKN